MPTRMTSGQEMANGYCPNIGGDEHLLQSRTTSTPRVDDMTSAGTSEYNMHSTTQRVPALKKEGTLAYWHYSGATGSEEVSEKYIGW